MSRMQSILDNLSNRQMLIAENILPKKYTEFIEEARLKKYFLNTDFEALDIHNRKICYIENGEWEYPLFHIGFINNMLANIIYCLSKGFLPEVKFCDKNGVNLWEQFLRQPYDNEKGLHENQGDVKRCDIKYAKLYFPKFPAKDDVVRFSNLYRKFVVFNDKTLEYFENEYNSLIKGKRVLGVLCRGTDYTSNKPSGHPIQPKVEDVINFVRKKNESLKCDYIYLATEEEKIYKMFDNAFPEKVITNQRHYYDEFYELRDKYGDKARISWVHSDRNNDNYYKSLEYMSSLFLLSKCNALIAGSCGGSQAALYLNGNSYEYWYLFDLGLY